MAFASTALRSILVPARTRIGEGAFADCRTLTEAKIQGDISSARHAFRNCTALVNTDIGATTTIPDGAFAGCTSLSEINNTESLRSIGKEAFYGTASLKNFVFAPGLAYIGDRAFASSGLTEISLPESLANIGNGAFFDCKNLVKVILPSSALSLSDYLFTNSPIADMPIPENLQSIGRYAMKGSSLVAVLLPSSFGSIGDGAMEDSKCLRAIDVNALASGFRKRSTMAGFRYYGRHLRRRDSCERTSYKSTVYRQYTDSFLRRSGHKRGADCQGFRRTGNQYKA